MKKKLILILSLCVALILVFTLAACGNNENTNTGENSQGGNINNEGNTGDNGREQGNSGDNTGNTGDTGNNQGSGSTGDNGNNQGNEDSQTTLTITLPTRAAILSAIGESYKVSAANSFGEVYTVASNGIFYYNSGTNNRQLEKKIGEYIYGYSDFRNGKYHRLATPAITDNGEAYTVLGRGIVGNILQYAGETVRYQTVENTTEILNRPAKKYTFTSGNANGYNSSYTETFIIDDATGACLQCNCQGSATDGFAGGNQKSSFVVTCFEYGQNNAAVTSHMNAEIEKIDVFEWDSEYITEAGLSAITAPTGTLFFSEWEYSSDRDSEYPMWLVQYKYYTDDPEGTVNDIRPLFEAFYNAGAKFDEYGEQSLDDLLYYDDEDYSFSFCDVYTSGETTYRVTIYADYKKNISPKYWLIDIEIGIDD
ncbi:MAG: hypothetical protein K5765_03375 [Clostridia bacterium]|nr:hypothetical protein [Clostridia bacterium]